MFEVDPSYRWILEMIIHLRLVAESVLEKINSIISKVVGNWPLKSKLNMSDKYELSVSDNCRETNCRKRIFSKFLSLPFPENSRSNCWDKKNFSIIQFWFIQWSHNIPILMDGLIQTELCFDIETTFYLIVAQLFEQ